MEANGHPSPIQAAQPSGPAYREHWVPRGPYQLYAREYPGQEPTVVLMHGFPDDLHLYDRLVPQLAGRRLVTFDFLGWGASDKPTGYPYTATNQIGDLDAVIQHLQLGSSGAGGPRRLRPPGDQLGPGPPRASGGPGAAQHLLRPHARAAPAEAIRLFSTPLVRSVARPISRAFSDLLFWRTYRWQVGRFFRDPDMREEFLPLLYRQFTASPSTHEAFFGLNRDLLPTVAAGTAALPRLRRFTRPVRIIFGAADPYLNTRVARRFHELFPTSELFLLPGARHYVQLDEPHQVARLILTIPHSG